MPKMNFFGKKGWFILPFLFLHIISYTQELSYDKPVLVHKIKKGETIDAIAQRYKVKSSTLAKINGVGSRYKMTNLDKLQVPINRNSQADFIIYKVVEGDSISGLSSKYNVSEEKLCALNLLSSLQFTPGMTLLIPKPVNLINRSSFSGFLSAGYHASNSFDGMNLFYYTLNARINYKKVAQKNQFINRFRTLSSLGFRHQLGRHFSKYIDRIEISNNIEYHVSKNVIPFFSASIKTQYSNSYFHFESGEKRLLSGPFSPSYQMFGFGFAHISEYFTFDFALYELKTTLVLNQQLYSNKDEAFGVANGKRIFIEQGMSFRADLYYYKDEKLSIQSNFYVFANKKFVDLDFDFELSYNVSKHIRISSILEIYHDRFYSDNIQYRNELVFGYSFIK